jgi:hypothetical protein
MLLMRPQEASVSATANNRRARPAVFLESAIMVLSFPIFPE